MALAFNLEGRLGLNIANFKNKLNDANKNLNSTRAKFNKSTKAMKKQFKAVTKAIGAMKGAMGFLSVASVAAFAVIGKAALTAADEINSLALSTNTSVSKVQALTVAFSQLGLEGDDVGDALNTLADRSKDAMDGMQSFVDDFKLIGVEVDDLRGKKPDQLFDTFADAIKNTKDPISRQAALVRILGDDLGRKLGPALLKGSEGFNALSQSARDAGVIMDSATVAGASRANKALNKLKTIVGLGVTKAFAKLGPAIEIVSEKLVNFLNMGKSFDTSIIPALRKVANAVGFLADVFQGLKVVVAGISVVWDGMVLAATGAIGLIGEGFNVLANTIAQTFIQPMRLALLPFTKFSSKAKAVFDDLSDFKIDINPITMGQFDQAVANVEASKAKLVKVLEEPMPSVAIGKLVDETEVLLAKLKLVKDVGEESGEGVKTGAEAAKEALDKINVQKFADKLQSTLGTGLSAALDRDFKGMRESFKNLLKQMAIDALAADIINAIGLGGDKGAKGGGALSGAVNFVSGFFADGGRPQVGRPAVIGERGPELFVPDVAGTVVPNHALGGGGTTINNNITIATRNPETFRSSQGRMASQFNSAMGA